MQPHLLQFLGEIEKAEVRLISWGLVDGFLSENDIVESAAGFIDKHDLWDDYPDAALMVEEMVSQGLLFRWHDQRYKYRSRMAESVRLVARLRQLFPRHLETRGGWIASPTLVADFRFLMRPREYPRREHPGHQLLVASFIQSSSISVFQRSVIEALLGGEEGNGMDLAGFQVRATQRILTQSVGKTSIGTMICAGTGSGKTLAFYLPALTQLAGLLERDSSFWTRAIAIYPRNELLKDQMTETVRQTLRLRAVFRAQKSRPIRVGAFFGQTPETADDVVSPRFGSAWRRDGGGSVCPFLVCPVCSGPMIWNDADRIQQVERLACLNCQTTLEPEEIVLTRKRLEKEPADLLFTTTEMMNQRLTDSRRWHLFGIGLSPHKRPVLVLLDEAHTYRGEHGAHVAFLLRRWRHRSKAKPQFVGLSATLMEAAAFFAQLTGLDSASVEEISPLRSEIQEEGAEYLLAVRGDPVSGASLLSTTIQTAMLLRRILDSSNRVSSNTYGQKAFLFTDDLDVTNRMYFSLLDAEGMDFAGRPDRIRHPGGSLASLRASTGPDRERRFAHGQSWDMSEHVGHRLAQNVYQRVGRVSSQDIGVDSAAELIVATASLEVGFNDPEVGAVLQHKAPRDPASFLQRKGRAGRSRSMRPWTVVVLSDFGRDRLAYQGYDLLFDPELRPRELPLGNRHVQKMQATFACLDWVSYEIDVVGPGWLWREASQPTGYSSVRNRQEKAAELIALVLDGGEEFDRLGDWLRSSLSLDRKETEALLWEAPRALMTSVLPTLHRRLATGWMFNNEPGKDFHCSNHPVPEFVPGNLFSDLALPEVQVWAAPAERQDPEPNPMPVLNSMREFAPGRISRRFGVRYGSSRHWIPIDPSGPSVQVVNLSDFCEEQDRELLGEFTYSDRTGIRRIPVWRPYAIHVAADAPRSVKDSSQSFLEWHTQILVPRDLNAGHPIDLPTNSPWGSVLKEIRFFSHLQHQPVCVRRFAHTAHAQVNLDQGQSVDISAQYVSGDSDGQSPEPVALGFSLEVDAVRVRLIYPKDWKLEIGSPEKFPALRAARFRYRICQDENLVERTSIFERRWISDITLAGITANAVSSGLPLQQTWQALREGSAELPLEEVLDVVFQTIASDADDSTTRLEEGRLADLRALIIDAVVLEVLDSCVAELWEPTGESWEEWLRNKFLATSASAFREAVQQLCPDVDSGELQIDLDSGPLEFGHLPTPEGEADFWLSENSPGGGGVVEHLLPRISESPRRFLDLWQSALKESDFEHADHELRRFLQWSVHDQVTEIREEMDTIRQGSSLNSVSDSFSRLKKTLLTRGLHISHPVMTAIATRLLKPGSTNRTDELLSDLVSRWRDLEQELGVEIDASSFTYAMSQSDRLDSAIAADFVPIATGQDRRTWRFNALSGMVWPRGSQARNHTLSLRSGFREFPEVERLLVTDVLGAIDSEVDFTQTDWALQCTSTLLREDRVALVAPVTSLNELREQSSRIFAEAIDTGSLLVYPRLRGIERRRDQIAMILEIVTGGQVIPAVPEDDESSSARLVVKTAQGSRDEVRDLIESLLAVELLAPSEELWLVSPWVSDLAILDNRAGGYAGLDPAWPKRYITLAEILIFVLRSNPSAQVRLVTRPDDHNLKFCDRLSMLASQDGCAGRLIIDNGRSSLHTKGLIAGNFAMNGSMNFTRNGVEVLDETVHLETDPQRIAQFRLALHGHYG